ncbi:hypothetical protein [Litoreibacter roseus]|uniref:Uncharacterized protein n=1 Tax=Litoreibacter roseus TaxID=2601869 RepID=A0A6N6JCD6_9RHOB|nr:hypothetical protein [Litoreibacter roseus]GFE63825.1 hypothetical protein KIN_08990 [Litoreibacter roseus]
MEEQFEDLFRMAQDAGDIGKQHNPKSLARRYQSDLIGLRASSERPSVDARALVQQIADELDRL